METANHYLESADGKRSLETIHVRKSGKTQRIKSYFDGHRSAAVVDHTSSEAQKTISISRAFANEGTSGETARPVPLTFFYVGKIPLDQALADGEQLGLESLEGSRCHKVLFKNVDWSRTRQTLVYYIDTSRAIPVRVDSYNGSDLNSARCYWSWKATDIQKTQGHSYAAKSEQVVYLRNRDEILTDIMYTYYTNIEHIQFNPSFSSVAFWPKMQPGAIVHDTIRKTTHTVPGKPSEASVPQSTSTQAPTHPPRADDVWYKLADVSFLLGMLVLMSAGIVWWRGRRR